MQVSLEDHPFGEDLDTPSGTLLPFPVPEGFTDDEVIEIVDFIRTNPEIVSGPNTIPLVRRFNGSAPIIKIERRDGQIEVTCGVLEGPLSGSGEVIRCIKEDGSYQVVSLGWWVS